MSQHSHAHDEASSLGVDTQILRALHSAGSGAVSGAELSHRLGISRAAIWARIEELRALGYEIEASPHHGYRLRASPDLLHADDLLSRLPETTVIGRDIRVFQETTSTNDLVDRLARDGVREGVVVFAEGQSKGRGRLGRRWLSPSRKGLWLSILLRPKLRPQQATQVTILGATALRRAIHSHAGLPAKIKWPNDILVNGKKVAGILTELKAELDQINYLVLGIGVDVNCAAADFPEEVRENATSLLLASGRQVSRAELAVRILQELDDDYARLGQGRFGEIAEEWASNCGTLGTRVRILAGGRELSGTAESLGEEGALLLRTEHGHLERIVGGDVFLEKQAQSRMR